MDPGELRNKLLLQQRSTMARNSMGAEIVGWTDVCTVWGRATALSGRELIAAQQKHAETSMRFRIRFREIVSQQWRVIWQHKAYDVLDVLEVEPRRYLDLDCQTGLRNG